MKDDYNMGLVVISIFEIELKRKHKKFFFGSEWKWFVCLFVLVVVNLRYNSIHCIGLLFAFVVEAVYFTKFQSKPSNTYPAEVPYNIYPYI